MPNFRLLPLALALAALPLGSGAAPTVLFCKGECFAVNDQGQRRAAPKGTELMPGERFETGTNSYAQIRVGPDADVGLGESGRLRVDQTTFRDRDVLILDQGRMRAVSGEAVGKPSTKPIELRTTDGIFAIRNADVEAKKLDSVGGTPGLTYVKPNVGTVALITGGAQTTLPGQGVQGITGGRLVSGQSFNLGEVALPQPRATTPAPAAPGLARAIPQPVATTASFQVPGVATSLARTGVASVDTLTRSTGVTFGTSNQGTATVPVVTGFRPGATQPVVSVGDAITAAPILDQTTGQTANLGSIVAANKTIPPAGGAGGGAGGGAQTPSTIRFVAPVSSTVGLTSGTVQFKRCAVLASC